jgi:hypothetical protein
MDASQSIPIVIPEKLRSSVPSKFTQWHFRGPVKSTHEIKDFAGARKEGRFSVGY